MSERTDIMFNRLKRKRKAIHCIELTPQEIRLCLECLVIRRNQLLAEGRPTEDQDALILMLAGR